MSPMRQLRRLPVLLALLLGLAQRCSTGDAQGASASGLFKEDKVVMVGGPAAFYRAGLAAKEHATGSARTPVASESFVELNDVHGASHHDHGASGEGHGEPTHHDDADPASAEEGDGSGIDTSRNHHHVAALEDIEVSIMLLGFLVLIMLLFFLVNYKDDDIRLYTWKISSTTVSIFTSVLLFQGFNHLGEYVIVRNLHMPDVLYQLCQCFLFLVLMQLVTASHSGVICDKMSTEDLEKEDWVYRDALRADNDTQLSQDDQDKVNKDLTFDTGPLPRLISRPSVAGGASGAMMAKEKKDAKLWIFKVPGLTWRVVEKKKLEIIARRRRTVGWGMIFAHMAGFAAISMGCTLQNKDWFKWHWAMTLIPVILVAAFMQLTFQLTKLLRHHLHENLKREKESRDRDREHNDREPLTNKLPETGKGPETEDVRMEIFKHAVVESESESQALAVSFLLIVSLRYAILRRLSNKDGFEDFPGAHETPVMWQVLVLVLFGVLFVILAGILTMLKIKTETKEGILQPITLIAGMTYAWGMLFAVRWASLGWHYNFFGSIMGRVAVASLLTAVVAVCIFILDFIDDRLTQVLATFKKTDNREAERIAKSFIDVIIAAFAVLIGFSWELCFEGAVHDVASMTDFPVLGSLGMAMVVATVVIIPWRRYIITKVMVLDEVRQEKRKDKRETAKDAGPTASQK